MSNTYPRNLPISTGIDPAFFEETLTRDIEFSDALLDLIDNSIDAARSQIPTTQVDNNGLPNNYNGYKITLRLSNKSIHVIDNCSGIDINTMQQRAFKIGARSSHGHGIGSYGIGMKRTLLMSGSNYSIVSDDSTYKYTIKINKKDLSSNKKLNAEREKSTKKRKAIISIYNLEAAIQDQITDTSWCESLLNKLSIRYAIFIKKGLEIKVQFRSIERSENHKIFPNIPSIRVGKPIKKFIDRKNLSNVKVICEVGVHNNYRFSGEKDHNQTNNRKLTKYYGFYYICNDRVIVSHSTETKYGFTAEKHSEHNGFVCFVNIIGKDPRKIPWNTTKTELVLHHETFKQVRDIAEPMAQKYRSEAKKVINIWKASKHLPLDERKKDFAEKVGMPNSIEPLLSFPQDISLLPSKNKGKPSNPSLNGAKSSKEKKPTTSYNKKSGKKPHTENWNMLLPENFPDDEEWVLNNIITEAKKLKIEKHPHSAAMLYRVICETSSKHFIKKSKSHSEVKKHHFEKGEGKGKNISNENKRKQGIDLQMIRLWLTQDGSELFPKDDKNKIAESVKKLKNHITKMNNVVHGNTLISSDEINIIRNETIYLIKFFMEYQNNDTRTKK